MPKFNITIVMHALFGVVFGSCFLITSYWVEQIYIRDKPTTGLEVLATNPVQLIVATAPLILGIVFGVIGYKQVKIENIVRTTTASRKKLSELANKDSLTGYGNRHSLFMDMADILKSENPELYSVILIDLDKFKFINDTLGHKAGNELLISFANRVIHSFRNNERLYRLGGDEFVVLIQNDSDYHSVTGQAERIVDRLGEDFNLGLSKVAIGGSIGITPIFKDDESATSVLARADLALYEAKAKFGNNFVEFDASMAARATQRMIMDQDMMHAIRKDEFYLEFQPIIGMDTDEIRGFEALIRWQHSERGLIRPDEFIPFAEASGFINKLGKHVLELACKEAANWPDNLSVSVNLSVEEFKNRNLYTQIMRALEEYNLSPERLVLEITESVFIQDMSLMRDTFEKLKEAGIRFALDDFGTGYSSINHLRQLNLDYLKIDRSLVDNILHNKQDQALMRNVIELGKMFNLTTTIEGIETVEQLEMLRKEGVSQAQGYLISRPVKADAIPALLSKQNGVKKSAAAASAA